MVVTELPLDDAKRALEALCIPIISPLQVSVCLLRFLVLLTLLMIVFPPYILFHQEAINQGPESLSKSSCRQLTIHIDRFAYIFRCVQCFVLLCLHTPTFFL
jgi:transportin-3